MNLVRLLGRPISFHRSLVTITKSVTSALMLCQAIYWSERTNDPDGWFYKSVKEWQEETGLTRTEQEGARKHLRGLGFWEEDLRRVPATLHFRVNESNLSNALAQFAENLQTGLHKTRKLDCGKPANQFAENLRTINTETTTEITSETTPKEKDSCPTPPGSDDLLQIFQPETASNGNGSNGNFTKTIREKIREVIWPAYIQATDRNPKVYHLTEKRMKHAVDRFKELYTDAAPDKMENTTNLMLLVVKRRCSDPFYRGENDRSKRFLEWERNLFRDQEQVEGILSR